MREIKFRVWDKITQSYSGGDLWSLFQSGKLYYGNALWKEGIVELFTGLYDKNGKEIYEGDIISVVHPFKNRKHIGEVIFEEYEFNIKGFGFSHYDYPGEAFSEGTQYMEVIGNIHDNPELLEKDN